MRVCYECYATPDEIVVIRMNDHESWYYCNYTHADKHLDYVRGIAWPFYNGACVNITLPVCV